MSLNSCKSKTYKVTITIKGLKIGVTSKKNQLNHTHYVLFTLLPNSHQRTTYYAITWPRYCPKNWSSSVKKMHLCKIPQNLWFSTSFNAFSCISIYTLSFAASLTVNEQFGKPKGSLSTTHLYVKWQLTGITDNWAMYYKRA